MFFLVFVNQWFCNWRFELWWFGILCFSSERGLLCINVWLSQQNSKPKHQEPTRADRSHTMLSVHWLKWTTSCLLINSCFMFSILVFQSLSLFYLIRLFKLGCSEHLWGFRAPRFQAEPLGVSRQSQSLRQSQAQTGLAIWVDGLLILEMASKEWHI